MAYDNLMSMKKPLYRYALIYDKLAATALTAHLSLNAKSPYYCIKDGVLIMYCQVENHLLETKATDAIIPEADSEIARFVKPSTM